MSCVPDVGDGRGRIVGRIHERLPFDLPVALPSQNLVAGDGQPRERFADEIRHDPEILGDDLGARLAKDLQHLFAQPGLRALVGRGELRRAAVVGTEVGSIEAHQMIDAIAVEQFGVAARARPQPVEIAVGQDIPAIHRKAPVLPCLTESVGGHAD